MRFQTAHTGDGRIWYLLALLAQAAAAYVPLLWMFHFLAIWNQIQMPGNDFLRPEAYSAILAGVLLLSALLGLALGKAWGWSWTVMIDIAALCLLALGVICGSLPPFWPAFFFVAAGAVMMAPGVRAFYSRHRRPWPVRWWFCEPEGDAELFVRAILAGSQILFSAGLTIILLPSMYGPLGLLFLLLFGAVGIFAGRKLDTSGTVGFYWTIAWCTFGVWVCTSAWRDSATRYSVDEPTRYFYLAACFLLLGVCVLATLARDIAYQRRSDRGGHAP